MVRRPTWILLLVFAFLIGFTWFFQKYQAKKADNIATSTPTSSPANLYDLANKQINEIGVSDSAGNKIDLYRVSGSSDWAIAAVPTDQADTFQIESISSQLYSLQVQETLSQTPPLDSIGLDTPAYTITMKTSDGSQLITYVGIQTAIGSGYYIRVDSGPVVIVEKVVMDDILNLLKNPPLLPTATPEVTATQTASPIEPGSQATPTP
jgi:hypothetical protein